MSITPAPWQVCDRGDGTVEVLSSHGCGPVCVVDGTGDEIAANAAMLAAAPELLVACKYLLENAEAAGWSEFMIEDARRAIAKAEGRDE